MDTLTLNEAHASVQYMVNAVALYLGHTTRTPEERRTDVLTGDGMVRHTPGNVPPALMLTTEAAQRLFEELYAQGFRSVHDRGGSDKLDAARKEHIEDLRKAAKLK